MKKKILAAVVAMTSVLSLAGCGEKDTSSTSTPAASNADSAATSEATSATGSEATSGDTSATESGSTEKKEPKLVDTGFTLPEGEDKTFTICVWNDEWKGFFEKYYKVPEGVTVKWVSTPNEGGAYQQKLDQWFENGGKTDDGDQIDLFLAEADYIKKYVNSDYTQDITSIGLSADAGNKYKYTVDACTDSNGKVKGASFQACPNVLIYRRSIAKDVLGTDDPAEVQKKLGSWDDFNAVAASAKDKGYYMTPSALETYRVFANNAEKAFLDADDNFQVPDSFNSWLTQAETFMEKGYTIGCGVWAPEKTGQMGTSKLEAAITDSMTEEEIAAAKANAEAANKYEPGKTMCFFGPAWYYNFCMGQAHDQAMGDWAVCKGPQEAFWGGTWMMVPTGADTPSMTADVIKAFTENDELLSQLVEIDTQYANKKDLMKKYADDTSYGNEFLGGQNDLAIMYEVAEGITWNNDLHTIYDQTFNETLPEQMLEYLNHLVDSSAGVDKETAWTNFYNRLKTVAPQIKTPE